VTGSEATAPKVRLLGPKKQSDAHRPSKDNDTGTSAPTTRSDTNNDADKTASAENIDKEAEKRKRKNAKINPLKAYFEGSTREYYHC
jgi:hypothetical protein